MQNNYFAAAPKYQEDSSNQQTNTEEQQIGKKAVFYYKMVAKTLGQYLSIYDGKTEYKMGVVMHQPAKPDHQGGFYVYDSLDQAIFADVPLKKDGLYFAPRTVIKCACWGDKIEYPNGKIAFEYLCPVQDMGMPKGYLATKAAMKEAYQLYSEKLKLKQGAGPKSLKKPTWKN
ncbi:hypothetical protein TTHERM_00442690 (macronuclear) [Tetrahymena thermophila SB210]|uniref:Uncharacterized protein n=1 Tax=Tetrahymena thermophila (strain SB210) TaxID=312017 RepID=I7MGW1_TETTS|nr:hypothetical protein TTHERM_00442690 [Tetrahymena thermophila SB210]EAR85519.1 hypothetical protein TTHERM_00442690 [Tetrahymena thermophila SB210]|eukprot:XP_001033182.1 hypothetical protein TTHERM_00442690 [Tetrahymena thermophila SB210]